MRGSPRTSTKRRAERKIQKTFHRNSVYVTHVESSNRNESNKREGSRNHNYTVEEGDHGAYVTSVDVGQEHWGNTAAPLFHQHIEQWPVFRRGRLLCEPAVRGKAHARFAKKVVASPKMCAPGCRMCVHSEKIRTTGR